MGEDSEEGTAGRVRGEREWVLGVVPSLHLTEERERELGTPKSNDLLTTTLSPGYNIDANSQLASCVIV